MTEEISNATIHELIQDAENGEIRPHPTINHAVIVSRVVAEKLGVVPSFEAGGWVDSSVVDFKARSASDFSPDDFARLQNAIWQR